MEEAEEQELPKSHENCQRIQIEEKERSISPETASLQNLIADKR